MGKRTRTLDDQRNAASHPTDGDHYRGRGGRCLCLRGMLHPQVPLSAGATNVSIATPVSTSARRCSTCRRRYACLTLVGVVATAGGLTRRRNAHRCYCPRRLLCPRVYKSVRKANVNNKPASMETARE
ncbi:hypothetical protein C4D60_Mb10t08220 [Musa balbisiana]|uniref:Uncharacterized protein n=1 Tax=Musa balbisiana TaxID=52838 RepID=A0A4V4H4N3_MUSBA|nr:hypothetical protein C4D60_Mb10t08220 [Musa balbisiana]